MSYIAVELKKVLGMHDGGLRRTAHGASHHH